MKKKSEVLKSSQSDSHGLVHMDRVRSRNVIKSRFHVFYSRVRRGWVLVYSVRAWRTELNNALSMFSFSVTSILITQQFFEPR